MEEQETHRADVMPDRCARRASQCRPESIADLFASKGYAPILERILHFSSPRDILAVAWTCHSCASTVASSVRVQLELQIWAHDLPTAHLFPRPLRELERVLRWQTHLSRLVPQRVDSFTLPDSSAQPKLRAGYALVPKREDGTPGWPTGCDLLQLPRSGESLQEERVAREMWLRARRHKEEAGEESQAPPPGAREALRIGFPTEAMTLEFDPLENLLVLAELIRLPRPDKILSAVRLHFYRLRPPLEGSSLYHPDARLSTVDMGSEVYVHDENPLRRVSLLLGSDGLICVTLRKWKGSNCVMVLDWKRGVMRGASWHEEGMSFQFLGRFLFGVGIGTMDDFELRNPDDEPLDIDQWPAGNDRASGNHLGESISRSPSSSTSSLDEFYDAFEELSMDKPDDEVHLALIARSLGEEQYPGSLGPSGWMAEDIRPLGVQTLLKLPKLRTKGPDGPDGAGRFELTGALIELDRSPRPHDPGLVLIMSWGSITYDGRDEHRHRGSFGTVPGLHILAYLARRAGETIEWGEWGAAATLQVSQNAYASIGTNKLFSLDIDPFPQDPAAQKRRARATLFDFAPLAVQRQGQVVSRSIGSAGPISPAEIDADVSSILLYDGYDPCAPDSQADRLCSGDLHGPPGATGCPPPAPPVIHRQSLKGATTWGRGGIIMEDGVFEGIVRSGTPFSMRYQEMDVDAGHVMEDIWFDGQRLVLIYGCRMDVLTF